MRSIYEKNYLINGNFDHWQRGTAFNQIASSSYSADRWRVDYSSADGGKIDIDYASDVPTLSKSRYSLKLSVDTTDADVDAGDQVNILQPIEGLFAKELYGRSQCISFWCKSNLTGTYAFGVTNSASNRSYIKTFTINSANTWEMKIIPFVHDTTGTWLTTTGVGYYCRFCLVAGSTYQGTDATWQAGNIIGTSGLTNTLLTGSNNFYLADVMLNLGNLPSPFATMGQDPASELALCQRYYYRVTATSGSYGTFGSGQVFNANSAAVRLINPVPMRVAPTAIETDGTAAHYGVFETATIACTSVPTIDSFGVTETTTALTFTATGALTAGRGCAGNANNTVGAYIGVIAEL